MYWFPLLDIAGNRPVKLLCMVLLGLCVLMYTLFILWGLGACKLIWIVWSFGSSVFVPRSGISSSGSSSFTFVDRSPLALFLHMSFYCLSDSGKCFLTVD